MYDAAITWASKAERTNYWKPFKDSPNVDIPTSPVRRLSVNGQRSAKSSVMDKSSRTEEYVPLFHSLLPPLFLPGRTDSRDEQYLSKLRGLGMSSDDEWKLYALRQHIFKIAQLQLKYLPYIRISVYPSALYVLSFSFIIPIRTLFSLLAFFSCAEIHCDMILTL